MFTRQKPNPRLEAEIDKLLLLLDSQIANSEEYAEIVERMLELHKIREDTKPEFINPNTALTVAANILGIVMIIRHEQLNVITSKALSFVLKPR